MEEVRWERMFPDQIEEAFQRRPVVYFTYGLCEPHGPHNALGLDALKAHGIAVETAKRFGGIVAPPHYWHIHETSGYSTFLYRKVGERRAWMTAVPPWVHFHEVCYHVRTADVLGFHAAVFLTGHYGPNWKDLKLLVNLMQPYTPTRLFALPDFEANVPGFDKDGKSGDHAGKVETSLLWSLQPDCVDMSRLTKVSEEPPNFAMGADADQSSRRIGDRMVDDEVEWLGNKINELLDEYAGDPDHVPLNFAKVEEIWQDVIMPRLPHFASMLPRDADPTGPPPHSRWRANWDVPNQFRAQDSD